jgi:hypothetical protein
VAALIGGCEGDPVFSRRRRFATRWTPEGRFADWLMAPEDPDVAPSIEPAGPKCAEGDDAVP